MPSLRSLPSMRNWDISIGRLLKNSRSHKQHFEWPSRPAASGNSSRNRPDGAGLRCRAGIRDSRPFDASRDSIPIALSAMESFRKGRFGKQSCIPAQSHLDNLCVLVDRNNGQLDIHDRMVFPMPDLQPVFESFGWQVHNVDATQYDGVFAALEHFRFDPRNGKPTAISATPQKVTARFRISSTNIRLRLLLPWLRRKSECNRISGGRASTSS